jgi:hypothetical protein
MMEIRRRIFPIALSAAVLAACEPVGRDRLGPDVRRGLDQGRDAASLWIADGRGPNEVESATAVALGYLERLRLGFGSPFRLIDYALADPRLDIDTRRLVAWSLLARTVDGASYQIDEAALDRAGLAHLETLPAVGHWHLELIQNAIREAGDPRSGELAVRLAYALAAAEGSLPARAPELVARAAALLRDRELARDDALTLLRAAASSGEDALALVARWRVERRLAVEQPAMAVLSQESELHAMELAPRLARALRELSLQEEQIRGTRPRATAGSTTLLSRAAALKLAALADSLNSPPQAPVAIAARTHRRDLVDQPQLNERNREARRRFVDRATSEERFAAEFALLRQRSPHDNGPALTALAAATSLRAYAQEDVWFPGFGGPSTRELEERFGLTVRFGEEVPAQWRPYYRRMLDIALSDLYRVLPALDLKGLTVVFADQPRQGATLAMHDPKLRRLLLPPGTTAGTIAHEVAHDLDWQVALSRYRVRGDYATDRATRTRQDRLALRLADLANGTLDPLPSSRLGAHARRPAEVFARNVDWFVAVSLAAGGRSNGYLSSVQDDMLTGYGTVRPPDITGAAGEALVDILDEVAPLYPATRNWFLRSYGLNRALTPYDLTRRVLEASVAEDSRVLIDFATSTRVATAFAAIERAREAGFAAIDAWICRSPGAAYHRDLERVRRQLVVEAAGARARGLAFTEASKLAGDSGRSWMARELFGPQWPASDPDSAMVALLEPIADAARVVAQPAVVVQPRSFDLAHPPDRCALSSLQY